MVNVEDFLQIVKKLYKVFEVEETSMTFCHRYNNCYLIFQEKTFKVS